MVTGYDICLGMLCLPLVSNGAVLCLQQSYTRQSQVEGLQDPPHMQQGKVGIPHTYVCYENTQYFKDTLFCFICPRIIQSCFVLEPDTSIPKASQASPPVECIPVTFTLIQGALVTYLSTKFLDLPHRPLMLYQATHLNRFQNLAFILKLLSRNTNVHKTHQNLSLLRKKTQDQ